MESSVKKNSGGNSAKKEKIDDTVQHSTQYSLVQKGKSL